MSVETPEQLAGLRRAGAAVKATIAAVRAAAGPGLTTRALDAVARETFERHGARSGPILTYGYPGSICLSVDAEIVHGVPNDRPLRAGSLLSIDVAAELDGYHADAATTIAIGDVPTGTRRLLGAGRAALQAGIDAAQPGATLRDIGRAVEHATHRRGFHVARELTGHEIGRAMHESFSVFNWPNPARAADRRLTKGLVFTIEPMIATARPSLRVKPDGWTVEDHGGALSTHEEHTLVICPGGPLILTS
jgi:methionyl aminopeptidase